MEKLLWFNLLLTIVEIIKTDISVVLFLLLAAQFIDLTTSNMFAKFPSGLNVHKEYSILGPVFYLLFFVAHIALLAICVKIMFYDNDTTSLLILAIIVFTRSVILIIGFLFILVSLKFNQDLIDVMITDDRKLYQYMTGIYQPNSNNLI